MHELAFLHSVETTLRRWRKAILVTLVRCASKGRSGSIVTPRFFTSHFISGRFWTKKNLCFVWVEWKEDRDSSTECAHNCGSRKSTQERDLRVNSRSLYQNYWPVCCQNSETPGLNESVGELSLGSVDIGITTLNAHMTALVAGHVITGCPDTYM